MDYQNINFFHKIKIKKQIGQNLHKFFYTPGLVDIESLRNLYFFDSISFENKSILDVGCWDGYFSFESELKGASEVVSLDNPDFRWGGMSGYNFLHDYYKSNAKFVCGNVLSLKESFPSDKKFDIVLCYGVLYHLSDPLRALINLFEITNEYLILEGIFYDSVGKNLELIECGFSNDNSNIYKISSGYMKYISNLYGFKIEKIDLFSLDVEGYELNVLNGLDLDRHKPTNILIEIYNKDFYNIVNLMLKYNYKLIANISDFNLQNNPAWDGTHNDYLFTKI